MRNSFCLTVRSVASIFVCCVHSVVKLSLLVAIFILLGEDATSCLLVVETVKTG